MEEQTLAIILGAGAVLLMLCIIIYVWRKEGKEATYFDENPVSGFWYNPAFEGLSRDYELIGCKRVKNGLGLIVSFIDESNAEIGDYRTVGGTADMNVTLKDGQQYKGTFPKGKYSRDLLLKHSGGILATYTRLGGTPPGRVAFADGETVFYTPRENSLTRICPVKYWRDASGNLLATVLKPTTLDVSLVRVIAIKKGLPPKLRAAVLAFYLV
jgi:hypothetical protein